MFVLIGFLFIILFVLENSVIFCASFSIGFVILLEMYVVLSNVPADTAVANINKIIPVEPSIAVI